MHSLAWELGQYKPLHSRTLADCRDGFMLRDACGGRLPRSWADDTVDDATPKRSGADDWEEAEADRDSRLQRF